MENELLGAAGEIPGLDDAPGQERIEMHGEIVDRGAARFGDILRPRAWLPIEKGGDVTDLDALFPSQFDDAVTR